VPWPAEDARRENFAESMLDARVQTVRLALGKFSDALDARSPGTKREKNSALTLLSKRLFRSIDDRSRFTRRPIYSAARTMPGRRERERERERGGASRAPANMTMLRADIARFT